MNRFRQCLPQVLLLSAALVCCATLAHAQPQRKPGSLTSTPCVTRTKLYCEIHGSGDPILFLHGLGGSSYSWRFMVPAFEGTHQVILIDLRGQGNSPKPHDKHYSILEQRDLIYQFILEHNLKKLTLVGNSYGGAISLLVTLKLLERPQDRARLANLILIDSAAFPEPLPLHLIILRTPILGWMAVHLVPPKNQAAIVLHESYYCPENVTPEQIEQYAQPIADPGGRYALLELAKQAIPGNFQGYIDRYGTIRIPVLIIWGEADRVLHPDYGERLKGELHTSRLVFIEKAGHIPQEEQPTAVICQIREFLSIPGICTPAFSNCPANPPLPTRRVVKK